MNTYCRWCMPDPVKADPTTRYEYTALVRRDGECVRVSFYLCTEHARALAFTQWLVEEGRLSDWEVPIRHDLMALAWPIRAH